MKMEARHRGEDIVDFGMGNPDLPTPPHVVAKLIEAASKPQNHRYSVSRGIYKLRVAICRLVQAALSGRSRSRQRGDRHHRRQGGTVPSRLGDHRSRRCRSLSQPDLSDSPIRRGARRRRSALHSADHQRSVFRPSRRGDSSDLAQAENADHQLSAQSDDAGRRASIFSSGSSRPPRSMASSSFTISPMPI